MDTQFVISPKVFKCGAIKYSVQKIVTLHRGHELSKWFKPIDLFSIAKNKFTQQKQTIRKMQYSAMCQICMPRALKRSC